MIKEPGKLRSCVTTLLLAAAVVLPFSSAEAAPVNSQACDTRAPADVMLVVDRSGSMRDSFENKVHPVPPVLDRLEASEVAVGGLLTSLAAVDRVGLVSYGDFTTFDQSLTFDKQVVSDKLFALQYLEDTYAAPAIRAATAELLSNGRPGSRKIILHFSDGYSFGDPVVAASEAKAAGVEFYAFSVSKDPRATFVNGRAQMAQQATDAAHYFFNPDAQTLYDNVQGVGDVVHTKQLTSKANSFTIRGTGLLALVNIKALINDVLYSYNDSADPALVSAGGSNQLITVPLKAPGLVALDLGVIKNSATGTQTAGSAQADAAARIAGLDLNLLGIGLKATAIQSAAHAGYAASAYSSTAALTTADLKIAGLPVQANVAPNTAIAVPALLSVVLNVQPPEVKTADSVKRSVAFAYISSPLLGSLTLAQSSVELSCK